MQDEAYKRCGKCAETKPLVEFYRCNRAKDGRQSKCKACDKANSLEWAAANPERRAAQAKRWSKQNPGRRWKINERYLKRYNERYPEKLHAHRAVNDAVRRGKLTKPDRCEDCGELTPGSRELHGHHADYGKPLEVEWLCQICHIERHSSTTGGLR